MATNKKPVGRPRGPRVFWLQTRIPQDVMDLVYERKDLTKIPLSRTITQALIEFFENHPLEKEKGNE